MNPRWSMEIRGANGELEVLLKDKHGLRASRIVKSVPELIQLLNGWEIEYSCATSILFEDACHRFPERAKELCDSLKTTNLQFLTPKEVRHALKLAENPYRPKEIRELRAKIDREIHAAEIATELTGFIDPRWVEQITWLRLRLDQLYVDWTRGLLS